MGEGISDLMPKREIELGRSLVLKFVASVKTAQIYDMNNTAFLTQSNALMEILDKIFETGNEVTLSLKENNLFLNETRLKVDFGSFPNFRFVVSEFKNRGIGSLCFRPQISLEEVKKFVFLFAKTSVNPKEPFQSFTKSFKKAEISNVDIEEIKEFDTRELSPEEVRIVAKKTFFEGISYLKGTFEKAAVSPQSVNVKHTRRFVRSIVDLLSKDESYMLGLTVIKNHEEYTLNHSMNVCILSLALATRLRLNRQLLDEIGIASIFHDVGKVAIPTKILSKPGPLTKEEFAKVKKHPQRGVEMMLQMKGLGEVPVRVLQCILEHHIKYDGSGYPSLHLNELGVLSRIVTITDTFDAMTTERVYHKNPFSFDSAIHFMWEKRGDYYDPLFIKAFVNTMGIYPRGTMLLLDTNEVGIVIEGTQDPEFGYRAKVKLITDRDGNRIDAVDFIDENGFKKRVAKILNPNDFNIDISKYF